jgi:hypothetical protein
MAKGYDDTSYTAANDVCDNWTYLLLWLHFLCLHFLHLSSKNCLRLGGGIDTVGLHTKYYFFLPQSKSHLSLPQPLTERYRYVKRFQKRTKCKYKRDDKILRDRTVAQERMRTISLASA